MLLLLRVYLLSLLINLHLVISVDHVRSARARIELGVRVHELCQLGGGGRMRARRRDFRSLALLSDEDLTGYLSWSAEAAVRGSDDLVQLRHLLLVVDGAYLVDPVWIFSHFPILGRCSGVQPYLEVLLSKYSSFFLFVSVANWASPGAFGDLLLLDLVQVVLLLQQGLLSVLRNHFPILLKLLNANPSSKAFAIWKL